MNFKKMLFWLFGMLFVTAIVLYLLLVVAVWAMQDRLMFGRRTQEIVETPDARNMQYEEVWVDVGQERSYGWWLPLQDAKATVLFSHGSGRNISGYLDDVALFHESGLSVLLYDYGGYGLSTGEPSEERCYADAHAFWNYLVNVQGMPPSTIILAGASMGSGVTCDLASRVAPAAVILESAFASVPDVLWDTYPYFPVNWICRIQFRNIDKVSGFTCPVLVMHSKDDTVVPFEHGQRLYEHINAPKTFVEVRGAHYGGKFSSKEKYLKALKEFFELMVLV